MILYHKGTATPVEVGDLIRIPSYRFNATVAGWDVATRTVWTWDNPKEVGQIHHARPWDVLWTDCEWRNE